MIYAQLGRLRLNTIIKFKNTPTDGPLEGVAAADMFESVPISEGTALEYRYTEDGEDAKYLVVSFIRPQKDGFYMETVGDRWIRYLDNSNLDDMKYLYYYATKCISRSQPNTDYESSPEEKLNESVEEEQQHD